MLLLFNLDVLLLLVKLLIVQTIVVEEPKDAEALSQLRPQLSNALLRCRDSAIVVVVGLVDFMQGKPILSHSSIMNSVQRQSVHA